MRKKHKKKNQKKKKNQQKNFGPPKKRMKLALSNDYVLIYQEEVDLLSRYILDYPNSETGGQLFGHWTYDLRPIVRFVLGPGSGASHETTFFRQDLEYLRSRARFLKEQYNLDHIGEWHSHHQLRIPNPSEHDARNIATNIKILGYERFLLCIGTYDNASSSLNAFLFTNGAPDYKQVPFLIKTGNNSCRRDLEQQEQFFLYPRTPIPNMRGLYLKNLSTDHFNITSFPYWLSDSNNKIALKHIIDYLNSFPLQTCIPTIDRRNRIHLTIFQNERETHEVFFPDLFPENSPMLFNTSGEAINSRSWWNYTGDILQSFISYYQQFDKYQYLELMPHEEQSPSSLDNKHEDCKLDTQDIAYL